MDFIQTGEFSGSVGPHIHCGAEICPFLELLTVRTESLLQDLCAGLAQSSGVIVQPLKGEVLHKDLGKNG